MKKRYLLLPFLIIGVILFILEYEDRYPISKESFGDYYMIIYPYFNNDKMDRRIYDYIDNIMATKCDYLYIYYDLRKEGNAYYISFYIYREFGNLIERKVYTLLLLR